VKFITTDVFGQSVVGSLSAWDHIEKRHPEMAGRENEVKAAIERPISVHAGNMSGDKKFYGQQIAAGFWKDYFPVAIVTYTKKGDGHLKTAYLVPQQSAGKVLWPKS
jgi:hypothetical protein